MRTAVLALPIVRPQSGHVCTRWGLMTFISFFLASSMMARLMSSSTAQPPVARASFSDSHCEISFTRRSANERRGSALALLSSSCFVFVVEVKVRILFFSKNSPSESRSASLRRHSEERTTMAPVRSMMWRRAFTAEGKKSDVSTRVADSASTERMSKPPARAGRSTPSMSRNTTLVLSSGGRLESLAFFSRCSRCLAASSKTASLCSPLCGMSE
mmetsp:Transcript_37589/g.111541  ORF Transcript_37589/g.111541 Transcript_37589/m.111541 type:complete len:215 (-) Transcript_37589:1218-1862(-)